VADGFYGADDGASSPELRQQALDDAVKHLVGRSRAWLQDLEGYLNEISALGNVLDERTAAVIEALGLTLDREAPPGTLRHVEHAATELLRTLTDLMDAVRPT
jgi:hypothetical protein